MIIIVLFIFAGKFAFAQITNVRNQISEAKKTQSALSNKLNILRSISDLTASSADMALYALPEANPSLQAISQLKTLAASNMLVLEDIKSSAANEESKDLSHIRITFNVVGTREAITAFIEGIQTIAPLTFVDKIDLSENTDLNEASVTTKTYFAPLPKTIPTITQVVSDLTSSEKSLLSEVNSLTRSVIEYPNSVTAEEINPSPFGQ